MGFSVSGSFAIVFLGLFLAVSAVLASGGNTVERFADARSDQVERNEAVHDTEINVTSVTLSGIDTNCDVSVTVNNTGSTTLALDETTLMIDNRHQTGWRDGATTDDDASTSLWHPGEQLALDSNGQPTPPDGVAVVTKTGVTDRFDTEGQTCE